MLQSSTNRRALVRKPSRQKSRIANGHALLPSSDGRSMWARLVKETLTALQQHCAGELSATRERAARRVAVLEAELIYLEDKLASIHAANGEPDTELLALYGTLADRQRRIAGEALGWDRKQRDVTTLGQLIAEDQERQRRELAEQRAGR
jgi:hypothetical protein